MMGLRDHLRQNGVRVSVINVTRHRQPAHDDLFFPDSAVDVLKTVHWLRPDVVHVHFGGSLFARQAALFILLSLRFGSANVFTFHSGGFPSSHEGLAAKPMSLRGLALRRLDAVIAVNQQLESTFERYGVKRHKLHLIEPSGAIVDRQAIANEPLPDELEAFASRHSPLLISVAQLEPEYGLDVQLDAFPAIRAQYPNAGLMLLGGGSLLGAITEQIQKNAHRHAVMLCGNVPRPKTLALLARASLLLRTTHYDGDALSIREALALGTRVLATDNGMRPAGVSLLSTLSASALAAAVPKALETEPVPVPPARNPMHDCAGGLRERFGELSSDRLRSASRSLRDAG